MPTHNQTDDSAPGSNEPIENRPIAIPQLNPSNPGENQVRSASTATTKPKKKHNTIVDIASIPKIDNSEIVEANRIANEANKISFRSVIVNLCLFLVTLILAGVAFVQYKSSQSAEQIAQQTLDSADAYNKKSLKIQMDANKSTSDEAIKRDEADSASAKRQTRSVSAQIAALQETQKEFDIENRPLIQVLNFAFDTLTAGRRIVLKFDFINYGKQPVKCLQQKVQVYFKNAQDKPVFTDTNYLRNSINSYLSGGAIAGSTWQSKNVITKGDSIGVKNGRIVAYIIGDLNFRNTVTYKISTYQYMYKLGYVDGIISLVGIKDTTIEINPHIVKRK